MLNKIDSRILRVFSADNSNWEEVKRLNKGIVVSYLFSKFDNINLIRKRIEKKEIQILFCDKEELYSLFFRDYKRVWCLGDNNLKRKENACNRCFEYRVGCWKYFKFSP